MKKEDIPVLNQLIVSLEGAENKLEKAYEEKDSQSFNNLKKMILQIQGRIQEVLS